MILLAGKGRKREGVADIESEGEDDEEEEGEWRERA